MATKKISTALQLQAHIETLCAKAIRNTCDRLLKRLQELIMSEYYDESVYNPTGLYHRTMQFYDSAVIEMVTKMCGRVFMNADKMNYPFSGWGWPWDGETQISEANEGSHGGWSTETSVQHKYFDEFGTYCENNAMNILKDELKKQGLNVKSARK